VAIGLITAGLITKAALFPLHFWLPSAHGIAPAPVSALLSALVVKAPIFILLRIWIQVLPSAELASHALGALGAGAILWGSFQAIIQDRIKLMVAYSTVAQIGYLFLVFPLLSAAANSTDPAAQSALWEGVIYFTLSHGVAKSAMFLVAGIILQATRTDYLKDMQGAASWVPAGVLVWGLAGISLIGLPPSGGFIAKWQLLTSAIRFGLWPYAVVIIFGGLLASGYVFRVLWHAFLSPEEEEEIKVPATMLVATIFLGATILVMGIRTGEVLSLLRIGAPFATEVLP
jgi:multicomponent Na+:H+ antiporter subunit D